MISLCQAAGNKGLPIESMAVWTISAAKRVGVIRWFLRLHHELGKSELYSRLYNIYIYRFTSSSLSHVTGGSESLRPSLRS